MDKQPDKPLRKEGPQEVEDIFAVKESRSEIREQPRELPEKKEVGEEPVETKPEREIVTPEEKPITRVPAPSKPSYEPLVKTPVQKEIETILSENLKDIFLEMTPQEQMQFKRVGEEAASKIEKLLQEVKVKVKEILNLIREWLKLIPGINKFFLEQEAKIKTDRILRVKNRGKTS